MALGIISLFNSFLDAMARYNRGIKVYGHFIQLQLGEPESVQCRKQTIITLLVKLLKKSGERALATHPFLPTKNALDYFVITQGPGVGKSGGPKNGTDHKPFSKVHRIIPPVGTGYR